MLLAQHPAHRKPQAQVLAGSIFRTESDVWDYQNVCFDKYAPITITGHPLNTSDRGDFKAESDK